MMYRCKECGAEFEEPKRWRESHGEWLTGCPNCLALAYDDVTEFKCEACYGITETHTDKYCEECKLATKQFAEAVILRSMRKGCKSFEEVVDAMRHVLNDNVLETATDHKVALELAGAIIDLAYERGCEPSVAMDLFDEWAHGEI